MSVDSMFSAIDAAIDGRAADASKAKKEQKQKEQGKGGQGFIPALISTIAGNNNKDVPGAPAGGTPQQGVTPSATAKTTGFADGVDGKVAPQAAGPESEATAASATDAATDPQGAAKKSGDDTIGLFLKIFGIG
jgi:hypothetical protein